MACGSGLAQWGAGHGAFSQHSGVGDVGACAAELHQVPQPVQCGLLRRLLQDGGDGTDPQPGAEPELSLRQWLQG